MDVRRIHLSIACAAVLLGAAAGSPRQAVPARTAHPFTVVSPSGRHSLPAAQVGDQWMVSLDDLAALFQLVVREDSVTGGVSVTRPRARLAGSVLPMADWIAS